MMTLLTCYYAHPKSWYGTPQEQKDVDFITSNGYVVMNPALMSAKFNEWRSSHDPSWPLRIPGGELPISPVPGMDFFLDQVAQCDVLAYRPFKRGLIGAGVAAEALHAYVQGKKVYRVAHNELYQQLIDEFPWRDVMTIEETRGFVKGELL